MRIKPEHQYCVSVIRADGTTFHQGYETYSDAYRCYSAQDCTEFSRYLLGRMAVGGWVKLLSVSF